MSNIDQLNKSLKTLESKRKSLDSELKLKKQRKKDIESIKKTLIDTCDKYSGAVNKDVRKMHENLYDGVKKNSNITNLTDHLDTKKEKSSHSDSNVSLSVSELDDELSNLNDSIDDLNIELTQVKANIKNTRSEIHKKRMENLQEAIPFF